LQAVPDSIQHSPRRKSKELNLPMGHPGPLTASDQSASRSRLVRRNLMPPPPSTSSAFSHGLERQPNSSILLFDPRREHSFVPTSSAYRPSRAAAVKDGRSCGHPKGSSLTAASTMAASSGSGFGGVHEATCCPALLTSADVSRMSSCAIRPRHILSRRCKVRSWPSGYEPGY
jgi:hypothetical protein